MRTSVDPRSETFRANRDAMTAALAEIEKLNATVVAGGGSSNPEKAAKAVARHRDRGKLLPRERIAVLLDADSPFLELSPLAGWGSKDELGVGLVTGIGWVNGVECLVSANDPTVKGGAQSPMTMHKALRAMDIAERNRLPLVNLTESGGADLPNQAEMFVPGGASFRKLTQMSAANIPTITLVFGSSTAGGAYVPGMSDYIVMQKQSAKVFLAGPPLVKMAINEDADRGGPRRRRDARPGLRAVGLPRRGRARRPADRSHDRRAPQLAQARARARVAAPEAPVLDPEELLGIASADVRVPFDTREIIARIVDGSRFEEFKPLYGSQLVTGWAELAGYPVGIIANNGILFSEESQKCAQFIQLCNRHDTPILFLQNITGFMVGTRYEQGGIIKDGAKLINAVSNSTVPHITLMVGRLLRRRQLRHGGRAFNPRFVFTWPNHRIAVMGPKQLAGVMEIVARQKAEKLGIPWSDEAFAPMREGLEDQVERESTALFATGRVWDDGIIDPRDSRTVLGFALSAIHSNEVKGTSNFGVFRM